MNETLCSADGLGMTTTLESLELDRAHVTSDNYDLWCRAHSFLGTNKVLKSLMVTLDENVTESGAADFAAFRTDIAVMLQENASLESLSIRDCNARKAEDYAALITAPQRNTAVKTLRLQHSYSRSCFLTDDEDKHISVLLKKNYALETLPEISINQGGDMSAVLRLNEAGRRYLVQDGSSISKGVEVLSAVSTEINCVFLHLLENPRLCDRSAVESASAIFEGSRGSTSPVNHNVKREQEQNQALKEGKESRRRRT